MTVSNPATEKKPGSRQAEAVPLDSATIRFAGDSGDGMQLAGTQFTNASAILGNDISTLPDFPAEIRAPVGTLAGVSGFQVHFSSHDIHTPGDQLDALRERTAVTLVVRFGSDQCAVEPDVICDGRRCH